MLTRTLLQLTRYGLCLLALTAISTGTYAQCDFTGNAFGNAVAPAIGAPAATISTCSFAGEYSEVTGITAGNIYTFSMTAPGYITVHQGSSNGTVLGFGPSPLNVTAVTGAGLFPSWSTNAACGTDATCHTTTVLNVGPSSPCIGTPAPGNTLASVAVACPGQDFTLSLQISTLGTGVGYQWYTGAGPIGGAMGPTLVTSQTVATNYYCEVTCNGNTTASAPVSVGLNLTPATPEDFESGVFPPGCWSETDLNNRILPAAVSAFGVGSGSANFNFYAAGGSEEFTLTSTMIPAVAAGHQISFAVAGAAYINNEIDKIRLEESSDGGATWSVIQEMTNQDGVGVLSTSPASGPSYVPVASDWQNLAFPLSVGTNRVRFHAISAFGNNVYLDNINVEPLPTCDTPTGISHVLNSTTEAVISWILASATDYNVEIRTSGLPGSGPVGLAVSASGQAGPSYTATLAPNTTYFAYVQANCAGDLSGWSGIYSFFSGYCPAGGTSAFDEKISNVTVSNVNNSSTSTAPYEDFTAMVVQIAPGVTYPISVLKSINYADDQVLVWIDLNNDLDFADPGENLFTSVAPSGNNPLTGTITVPNGTPPGNYTMRIRLHDSALGPNATPCGNSTYGQVEDYTVSICSPALATLSVIDDCANGTFEVDVNIGSFGSGSSAAIQYAIGLGTPNSVVGNLGSNLLGLSGTTTSSDEVSVKVGNGTGCVLDLGAAFSNCPDTLVCNDPPINEEHCYTNGDTRTFHYVAEVGQTVTLNFIQGDLDVNDAVNFYDGPDNLSPSLGGGNFNGDMSTADFNSTGRDLYFEILSGASNSCFDGGQSIKWQWTVQCTPNCTPPVGLVEYQNPAASCNPPGFSLNVLVIDAGAEQFGGVDPLSTVDVRWTVNGGSPGMIPGVGPFVPTTIGPFPLGSVVNVVLGHGTNSLCDANLGDFTQANVCPPANDDCTNAQPLTIAGVNGCPGGAVTGTTSFATSSTGPSIPAPTCNIGTGTLQDVWYTFNTGSFVTPLRFNFGAGTATNFGVALYQAGAAPGPDCVGAFIGCLPNSPLGINFTGFPANTTYYLRVFTYSTSSTAGTFTICVNGSMCAQPTGIASSGITDNQATITWAGPFSNYIIEYGPVSTFTTPGTGATAGPGGTILTANQSPLTLTGLSASTQYRFFIRRNCGGTEGYSFNLGGFIFTTLPPPPPPVDFGSGVTCGAQPPLAIPDNGCGSNNALLANITGLTPPGTTLGVDVSVESVDLIITHTWRGDLQVSLISPGGQVRNLVVNTGGSLDNFGNPATCTPLKFKDGGAAPIPAVASVIGTVAPAQPLSTFSGPVSGQWRIRICDSFGADVGQLVYAKVNFAPCVGPNFSTSTVTNCAENQYSVNVTINSMGSAASYAISNNLNGNVVTAGGTGTYTVGPFTSGAFATLTFNHSGNALCNASVAGLVAYCPPPNDLCSNAIPIACNQVVSGYTIASTTTGAPGFCGTSLNTAGGVWYTVQGWDGPMTVSTCTGTNYDSKIGVFTGSCPVPSTCNTTCAAIPPATVDCDHPAYATTIANDTYCCNVDWDGICQGDYEANGGPTLGGGLTCVAGNDDACGLQSQVTWQASAGQTYYIYVTGFGGGTGSFDLSVQCGSNSAVCSANGLRIEVQTDTYPDETTWEILNEAGTLVVVSGGPYANANSVIIDNACLPNGCYRLRVLDAFGDGMVTGGFTGGYVLRNASNARIIDNSYNFNGFPSGSESAIIGGLGFCLPIGTDALIASTCDRVNWVMGHNFQAVTNPAVSAQWQVGNQTLSGYEFWVFDPNGSYSARVFHSHAVTMGFGPVNAVRATKARINDFPGIPAQRLLNVRVRSRVVGVNSEWGPACRMVINPNSDACPPTSLQTSSGNQFSCGVDRTLNQSVWAQNVPGANQYEFRFRYPPEGTVFTRSSSTRELPLNWTGANALNVGATYEVEVRARKGPTWCVSGPLWGQICTVRIVLPANGGASNMVVQGNGSLTMYPNPNRGDQLYIALTEVSSEVSTVSVDMYDLSGSRVVARTIAVQDGYINTVLDLNGELAAGIYMVNITAGDRTYTERLAIQP